MPIPRPPSPPARCAAAGGMVSFVPRAGGPHGRSARERAVAICESTRLFTLAESLGGVESLIELPAVMTHASVAGSPLEVDPALIRLSCGIEAEADLLADLRPPSTEPERPSGGMGCSRRLAETAGGHRGLRVTRRQCRSTRSQENPDGPPLTFAER